MNKEQLLQDLIIDEGLRTEIYYCTEGVPTIGVGRNLERGISKDEALYLLTNDLNMVETELDARLAWWRGLPDDAQRGLANICFNIGYPSLAKFVIALGYLEEREFDKAADEFLDSNWANQVGQRATRVTDLIRNA